MKLTPIASLLVLSCCVAAPVLAEDAKPPTIKIDSPWLRATPKGAPVIGGYARVTNTGSTPDRLVGAEIPMAKRAEVHSMSMKDGMMHMEQLDKGLPVPPGATVTLTPGGYHLMFLKPSAQIKEGQTVKGTMLFEKAGAVPVTFAVGGMGAKEAPGGAERKDVHTHHH